MTYVPQASSVGQNPLNGVSLRKEFAKNRLFQQLSPRGATRQVARLRRDFRRYCPKIQQPGRVSR